MKYTLVGIVALVAIIAILLLAGVLPPEWFQVLGGRVANQVEEVIGKLDVRRQEVLNAIENAEKEIARLQRVEAESRVEADSLAVKLDELTASQEEARQGLLWLADLLEAGESVRLSDGRLLTEEELEAYAKSKRDSFETLSQRIATYQEALTVLRSTAEDAHTRWTEGRLAVQRLQAGLELLDARILALRALRPEQAKVEAAPVLGDEISIAEKVLQDTLTELEKEAAVIAAMQGFKSPTAISDEAVDKALDAGNDLASELRELAGD